jgi:hypothetical protein
MDTKEFLKEYIKDYLDRWGGGFGVGVDFNEEKIERAANALLNDDFLFQTIDQEVEDECYNQGLIVSSSDGGEE